MVMPFWLSCVARGCRSVARLIIMRANARPAFYRAPSQPLLAPGEAPCLGVSHFVKCGVLPCCNRSVLPR